MIQINRETDKLVVLNYPFEGGGKFISLVLALHPKFVHQDKVLASLKMKYDYDQLWSFRYSLECIEQNKPEVDKHFEFGCFRLAGFHNDHGQMEKDDELANNVFRTLCHNNTHYFPMVNQNKESVTSFTHFYDEIHKTLLWLDLDDVEEEYVDTLRKKWIETYRIGF